MTYAEFVLSRTKPMSVTDTLTHSYFGIITELGEFIDAWKKHWVYERPLDLENIKEELGDLAFYLQMRMNAIGLLSIEQTEEDNAMSKPSESIEEDLQWFVHAMSNDYEDDMVQLWISFAKRFDLDWREVLTHNVAKLTTRYPNGTYTNQDAIERKDKQC